MNNAATYFPHHAFIPQSLCAAMLLFALPAFAAKPDAGALQSMLKASSSGSNVACAKDTYGNVACTVDGTAVDVNDDCTSNMAFGGVTSTKGTTLADGFNVASAKPVAHVGEHQLLCIQATQRKEGTLLRALVKAVPTKTVKGCKGNDICKGADTPIQWKRSPIGTACTLKTDGHYTGDCATGWVDGKDIEEYSMGLNPEDTGA
ncbi:MAG TPA: hypothetical protein VM621_10945 [Luteibacter sp.]|uniref:hypothetical protein n=1 Tax=Luteibacter sp. TaxID=1886636 RepID=UPI002B7B61AE|nr:hypothetical protein [Luteibacter sp.]HVI55553.1 hypothetical protein [Luteibacter sp.]